MQWNDAEILILKDKYPEQGTKIDDLLERHSREGIKCKAAKLGIEYKYRIKTNQHKWTESEIIILKNNYPEQGVNIPVLMGRHSKESIKTKAYQLGISYNHRHVWTKKEDEILTQFFPEKGYNIPKLLKKGITFYAIHSRAKKIGVSYINKTFVMDSELRSLLDGIVISDGYISKPRSKNSGSRLVIAQSENHKEWLFWLMKNLREQGIFSYIHKGMKNKEKEKIQIMGNWCNYQNQYWLKTYMYDTFVEQRDRWYPNGRKRIPEDISLSPLMLTQWYLGDGCLTCGKSKQFQVTLCSEFPEKDIDFLIDQLHVKYGWYVRKYKKKRGKKNSYYIKICRRDDVENFLNITLPYSPGLFSYKWRALEYYVHNKTKRSKTRGLPVIKWSDDELEILNKKYPMFGTNIPELINMGRTQRAIKRKANKLGLNCIGGIKKKCVFCGTTFFTDKFHPYKKLCDDCILHRKWQL